MREDYLFCHGCGRRLVRISKVDDRYRCTYCLTTWISAENYAKGIEGREPLDTALALAKKEGVI